MDLFDAEGIGMDQDLSICWKIAGNGWWEWVGQRYYPRNFGWVIPIISRLFFVHHFPRPFNMAKENDPFVDDLPKRRTSGIPIIAVI